MSGVEIRCEEVVAVNAELRRLRESLYRPGADASTVDRFLDAAAEREAQMASAVVDPASAASRPTPRAVLLACALVAVLLGGALLVSRVSQPSAPGPLLDRGSSDVVDVAFEGWPVAELEERRALARSMEGPSHALLTLLRRLPSLVRAPGTIRGVLGGAANTDITLDTFSPLATPSSQLSVLVHCPGASDRLTVDFDTLAQRDSAVVAVPLAVVRGRCDAGFAVVRYRPFLGMLPTSVRVEAAASMPSSVILTG